VCLSVSVHSLFQLLFTDLRAKNDFYTMQLLFAVMLINPMLKVRENSVEI
jgi:hypothetical protein